PADRAFLTGRSDAGSEAVLRKLPATRPAQALALLDKLDSIAGFFAAGRIPTGSEDPFGVRRIGNGLVALLLLLERGQAGGGPALLREHIQAALEGFGERVAPERVPGVSDQIFDFLVARLRAFLLDEPTEAVNATLAAG